MVSVQVMSRAESELEKFDSMFVAQTKKGCVQEIFGCEATNEFKIYPSKDEAKGVEVMYSLEESSFIQRLCCKNARAFDQTIWMGTKDAKGGVVLKLHKDLTCGVASCQCCCNPAISFMYGDDSKLGSADVPFFFCLPKISVKGPEGTEEYSVQMPSCMGGICVDCMAEGCCNCKIPFYIYPPGKGAKGEEVGKIIKMWRGMGTEVFTDAASFQLEFPKGIDTSAKARLLGTTMFLNMLFFEKGNE